MDHTIDSEALQRLIRFELSRLVPGSREEATKAIYGRIGAYDLTGSVIESGINSYFASRAVCN